MDEVMLFWGLGLLAAALLLLVVELFVPSGGIISVTSILVAIAGVVCLFRYDVTWGLIGVLMVLIGGPVAFSFGLRIWPETPVGRAMLGEEPPEAVEARQLAELRREEHRRALLGRRGQAMTDLRPVGAVELAATDDHPRERIEAIAEGAWIERGQPVRVTGIEHNEIRVRKA